MTRILLLAPHAGAPLSEHPTREHADLIEGSLNIIQQNGPGTSRSLGKRPFVSLVGSRLSDPNAVYRIVQGSLKESNLLVYYTGDWVEETTDILFKTSSGSTRKSMISLTRLIDSFTSNNPASCIVIAHHSSQVLRYSGAFSCGPSSALLSINPSARKAGISSQVAFQSFLEAFRHLTHILPSITLEDILRVTAIALNVTSYHDAFYIHGNIKCLSRLRFRSSAQSAVWRLDPDNFGSQNEGSREDGVQQLRYALTQPSLRESAKCLLMHFAANDPSARVRSAADDCLRHNVVVRRSNKRKPPREILERHLPSWISIPAGAFTMGSSERSDPHSLPEERPEHRLYLSEYRIQATPVSVGLWRLFVGRQLPPLTELREESRPITHVSWYDAIEFSEWLTETCAHYGMIKTGEVILLPSEAEWEKAARGFDGQIYPWGDRFERHRCNCRDEGIGAVVTAGLFSPAGDSPFGVKDMSGNVWEWTRSLWGKGGRHPDFRYPYSPLDGRENLEASSEIRRVIRGGAYYYFDHCLRAATRNVMFPDTRHSGGGIRLVLRSVLKPDET